METNLNQRIELLDSIWSHLATIDKMLRLAGYNPDAGEIKKVITPFRELITELTLKERNKRTKMVLRNGSK